MRQGAGQNGSILPLNNHSISSSQPVSSMDATAHPGPWLLPFSSLPLKGTWLPPRTSSPSCPGSPLWQPKFRRLSEQQRFLCRRKIHFPLSLYSSAHPNPRGLQRTRRLPTECGWAAGLPSAPPASCPWSETAGRRAAVPTQTSGCCPTAVVGSPLKDLAGIHFHSNPPLTPS